MKAFSIPLDYSEEGDNANVHWRAVPQKVLRLHPLFQPLPKPNNVYANTFRDLSNFRQQTWQWDYLHRGRLTTSILPSCLGFHEQAAANILHVPKSLQGHHRAIRAWEHLKSNPPNNWNDVNQDFNPDVVSTEVMDTYWHQHNQQLNKSSDNTHQNKHHMFIYNELNESHKRENAESAQEARMAWGEAQEATAILVAVNYFSSNKCVYNGVLIDHSIVGESGMLTIEGVYEALLEKKNQMSNETNVLEINKKMISIFDSQRNESIEGIINQLDTSGDQSNKIQEESHHLMKACDLLISQSSHALYEKIVNLITSNELPLLGASPDGIIRHHFQEDDPLIEILEVKCSSPFIDNNYSIKSTKRMGVRQLDPKSQGGAPSWYIPQIQMEIFCAGPQCRSGILIKYCPDGAAIYRIARSDEYILEMLLWISEFYKNFISHVPSNQRKPPPLNFFNLTTKRNDGSKYCEFLHLTETISKTSMLLDVIPGNQIQRSNLSKNFFI